ncbi:MAG: NAD(P)/FAD-dependent oxidoreductase [Spirochaetales bacterium]|nr:NAD(P)/FAD-dependent oxidoreductase [Spirochaetales bacterium]
MKKNVIIIGNGAAGIRATSRLLNPDHDVNIKVFTEDAHLAYHRPRLIDHLSGRAKFEDFLMKREDFYSADNLDVEYGVRIEKVDPVAKVVIDSQGKSYGYDDLILAVGASSFVPPIENVGVAGVFALRSLDDSNRIIDYIAGVEGKKAVVLGGGLLGIETANSLLARGCDVSVVEMFDYLLPRQLDRDGGEVLQGLLEEKGLKFYLGTSAKSILGDGAVSGVALANGTQLDADIVVVSAGVRPNLDLAKASGIEVNRGILVNDRMETNFEGVYAIGDCCEHRSIVYGQVEPAWQHADVAAGNILGDDLKYSGTKPMAKLKVTGIPVFSTGDISKDEGEVYSLKEKDRYIKVFVNKERITSAMVIGTNQEIAFVSSVSMGKEPLSKLLEMLN